MGARIRHAVRVLTPSRPDRERGTSLVEFAIVLPVFLVIVLGLFSGGVAYNRQIALRNAAREGARYASTVDRAQVFTNGNNWASNMRDLVVERSEGELTSSQVCVALVDNTTGTAQAVDAAHTTAGGTAVCDTSDTTDSGLRVQVTVNAPARIEALVFGYTVNLKANAVSHFEGT
jgi:Flp pilus assembly protein TadG